MNYYEILELKKNCKKCEIKKKYHELSLKYHPDKNNGEDEKFKKINEAYEILYDDTSREKYDIKMYFKGVNFTDEDYELMKTYYYQFINSNEFKLMKLLYESIPEKIKQDLWTRFKKKSSKELVKSQKTIDIKMLYENTSINLLLSKEDYENNILKIIHIITNNGIYYLYLRKYLGDIVIDNDTCTFVIHFFIR